jgi:hypothetical protein
MSKNTNTKAGPVVTKNAKGEVIEVEAAKGKQEAATKRKRGEIDMNDPFMRQTITVERLENPKRKGSASAKRFNLYKNGMTVGEFLKAGGRRGDVNWDSEHEHITLTPAKKCK